MNQNQGVWRQRLGELSGALAKGMRRSNLVNAGAVLTLGAAGIHFAVAPEHFQEYWLFGVFFILAGLWQVALAIGVLVDPRRWLVVGTETSLAIVALWVLSRTTGVPLGPTPWRPEKVGIPDVGCSAMEVLAALLFFAVAIRWSRAGPRSGNTGGRR